jgi:hypothetical protein
MGLERKRSISELSNWLSSLEGIECMWALKGITEQPLSVACVSRGCFEGDWDYVGLEGVTPDLICGT